MDISDILKEKLDSEDAYELGTVEFEWELSKIQALEYEASLRGHSVDFYLRIASSIMLDELQEESGRGKHESERPS